jgi:hypothetical protein
MSGLMLGMSRKSLSLTGSFNSKTFLHLIVSISWMDMLTEMNKGLN